jgi:hypothetical protein
MAILILFVLGIANFAMVKAVLESGHPLLGHVPWYFHMLNGRISLLVEFIVLLGVMLMVESGSTGWAYGYFAYSLINATAAWLILSGRV